MQINKNIIKNLSYVFLLIVVVILFSINFSRFSYLKQNLTSKIFLQLQYISNIYELLHFADIFNSNSNANQNIVFSYDEYRALSLEVEILRGENAELKKLLNIVTPIGAEKTSAEVIFINNGIYSNNIKVRLKNGSLVEKGSIAINHEGLVGKVVDVKDDYANIMLITDSASRVAVKSTKSSTKAILIGKNSTLSELSYFAQNPEVEVGHIFTTLYDGSSMISGIPVVTLEKYHNGKFYTKSVVNFDKLNYISILNVKK